MDRKATAADLVDEVVLTRSEAAAILAIRTRTLDDWHARGEGPPVAIIGGQRRYLRSSVLRWVREHETAAADARRIRPGNRRARAVPAVDLAE